MKGTKFKHDKKFKKNYRSNKSSKHFSSTGQLPPASITKKKWKQREEEVDEKYKNREIVDNSEKVKQVEILMDESVKENKDFSEKTKKAEDQEYEKVLLWMNDQSVSSGYFIKTWNREWDRYEEADLLQTGEDSGNYALFLNIEKLEEDLSGVPVYDLLGLDSDLFKRYENSEENKTIKKSNDLVDVQKKLLKKKSKKSEDISNSDNTTNEELKILDELLGKESKNNSEKEVELNFKADKSNKNVDKNKEKEDLDQWLNDLI